MESDERGPTAEKIAQFEKSYQRGIISRAERDIYTKCKIRIRLGGEANNQFNIIVEVTNASDEPAEIYADMSFRDIYAYFTKRDGEEVMPCIISILGPEGLRDKAEIAPGESRFYPFKQELGPYSTLYFRTWGYAIEYGQVYQVRVSVHGNRSNTVEWTAPIPPNTKTTA